jgi:peptidoglycan/LPS O-acetylase OafA/YrhL
MPEHSRQFRGDIQGLRALAVGLVVLYHGGLPFLTGGYVGVDVFFVISGFLITTHLLQRLERTGRVGFADFYARRARRILPASLLVVVLSVAAALIWMPPLLMREVWFGAVATALYVPNILFGLQGTNYLAESTPSLFQHYWSLGIEEQFYLLWPLVLFLVVRFLPGRRRLVAVLVTLTVVSFVAGVWLTFQNQPWAFFGLPTRAWELAVGGIVAAVALNRESVLPPRASAVVGWAGVAGIVIAGFTFTESTQFPGFAAALPVVATAAVILAGSGPAPWGPSAVLSLRPLLFVGTISYSLYLVHWPLLIVPQAAVGFENPLPLWLTLTLALAAVPLAWILYRWVETPARDMRWLTAFRPRRTLLAAGVGSVLIVAATTGSYAASSSVPLHEAETVAASAPSEPPALTTFVPANLEPSLRAASDDQPPIYDDGCHLGFDATKPKDCVYGDPAAPRIALFGDSHASQWFPALWSYAQANGMSLEVHSKSSCPSVDADLLRNAVPYTACTLWRDAVFDRLASESPALVVLANYEKVTYAHPGGGDVADWKAALGRTLERIDAPTVVMADTPDLGTTPSVCLSAHLGAALECGRDRSTAVAQVYRDAEREAAQEHGAAFIDLTDYLCTTDECGPIIGDTLAYRDAHHLTATFSAELAVPLTEKLADAGFPGATPLSQR